ncbi:hypothetical protein [Kingella potus]|uniref:hypothetical protein n=1 Tax=Kingella potus TaxID=265175 RepID=UPI001FD442DE|nr:hypothetical protein [Kingella potus]UOP00049.1 hypothetical protein LVJ84_08580 [Kingella potus]
MAAPHTLHKSHIGCIAQRRRTSFRDCSRRPSENRNMVFRRPFYLYIPDTCRV